MSIQYRFASHSEARSNNWFSRRHQTSEAHVNACALKAADLEYKARDDIARTVAYSKRAPQEQLTILDTRFGLGNGAVRERAKLKARIEAAKPVAKQASPKA